MPSEGVTTFPGAASSSGVGALTATTSSATIASLYTGNANNLASWPGSGDAPPFFFVRNLGTTGIAVCIYGGTCTCAANGVAATNGVTIPAAAVLGFSPRRGTPATTPTIVACSSTDAVEIDQ
jgi:hypothetical protein